MSAYGARTGIRCSDMPGAVFVREHFRRRAALHINISRIRRHGVVYLDDGGGGGACGCAYTALVHMAGIWLGNSLVTRLNRLTNVEHHMPNMNDIIRRISGGAARALTFVRIKHGTFAFGAFALPTWRFTASLYLHRLAAYAPRSARTE